MPRHHHMIYNIFIACCLAGPVLASDVPPAPPVGPLTDTVPIEGGEQNMTVTFSSVRGLEANPGHDDWLWTNFGEGIYASNDRHYVAFGNNAAIDGNACVYEYDPETHQHRRVVDLSTLLDRKPGTFGHGKLHGRLDQTPDGWIYMATYCSIDSPKLPRRQRARVGSRLLRYNVFTDRAEDLGTPVPGDTYPMNGTDTRRAIFHGVGLLGGYIAYDLQARRVLYQGPMPADLNWSQRVTLIDPKTGCCYGSDPETRHILKYDPADNRFSTTSATIPPHPDDSVEAHPGIRVYTRRRLPDGSFLAMTSGGVMFSFWPDQEKTQYVGLNYDRGAYCPALALSEDSRYIYYTTGSHDPDGPAQCCLIRLDTETMKTRVLADLAPLYKKRHNYLLGTSYSITIDHTGRHLLITINGRFVTNPNDHFAPAGQPAFLYVQLPEELK